MQMKGHFLAKRTLYFIFSGPLFKKRFRATDLLLTMLQQLLQQLDLGLLHQLIQSKRWSSAWQDVITNRSGVWFAYCCFCLLT